MKPSAHVTKRAEMVPDEMAPAATVGAPHALTSERPTGTKRMYPVVSEARPGAIVIHCSDPRFQVAFEQFLKQELGLEKGHYIPIIVGGGAGVLGHPEQLPKEFKFLKERLEHYHQVFPTAKRIVLINHEGCRYYEQLKVKTLGVLGPRLVITPEKARADLSLVGKVVRHFLSHIGYAIELYYARFADAERTRIEIEKVEL